LVLGHESTGVVVARGREVTHVAEGDQVMLTWVQRDRYPHTPDPTPWHATYQGKAVRHGDRSPTGVFTWADTIIADQQYVVQLTEPEVPTDVTSIVGCAVMTGCGAAVHAGQVRPGQSVAVIGAGGVGLCVIQAAYNNAAWGQWAQGRRHRRARRRAPRHPPDDQPARHVHRENFSWCSWRLMPSRPRPPDVRPLVPGRPTPVGPLGDTTLHA